MNGRRSSAVVLDVVVMTTTAVHAAVCDRVRCVRRVRRMVPSRVYGVHAAAVVVVTLCSMASCEPPTSSTVDVVTSTTVYVEHRPPCDGPVVTVDYAAAVPCDVTPPQRLDVWYPYDVDDAAAVLDCRSSGGTYDDGRGSYPDVDGAPPPPPPPSTPVDRFCRDVDY